MTQAQAIVFEAPRELCNVGTFADLLGGTQGFGGSFNLSDAMEALSKGTGGKN